MYTFPTKPWFLGFSTRGKGFYKLQETPRNYSKLKSFTRDDPVFSGSIKIKAPKHLRICRFPNMGVPLNHPFE